MLSVILQYSTQDFRFLEVNLKQTSKFADQIIIPICSHFFNGSPENEELLKKSFDVIAKFPKAKAFIFPWEGEKPPNYYHNLSRAIGTDKSLYEWLLFIDADEIFEDSFLPWFESIKEGTEAWVFTCYWYFRSPEYRSTKTESAGILLRKRDCYWRLDDVLERQQLYQHLWDQGKLRLGDFENILDLEGNVMLHHYSWVRTKEQMLNKVSSWGHKNDKPWITLVEEEFSREFNGTDFVHGYDYDIVNNKFNL
jgi:hypothetical protein